MIAKLFSEPRQHKSSIHKLIQRPCFFFSFVVSPTTVPSLYFKLDKLVRVFRSHFIPLCVSFCPLELPTPTAALPPVYFLWFIKPYSADVRQSWPGVSWVGSLLKICISCLDSLKLQHPPHPKLTPPLFGLFNCNTHTHEHTHTLSRWSIVTEDQMICSGGIDQRS